LNINGGKTLITKSGIVLTYFYIALLIPLFVIFGYDLYFRTNPHLHRYDYYNAESTSVRPDYIADIPVMFEVTKSFYDFAPLTVKNYTEDNQVVDLLVNQHICSDEEYKSYNKTMPMDPSIVYLCTNFDQFFLNPYTNQDIDTIIRFKNCTALTYSTRPCIGTPPKDGEEIFIAINIKHEGYSDSYDHPPETKVGYQNKTLKYGVDEPIMFATNFIPIQVFNDVDAFSPNPKLSLGNQLNRHSYVGNGGSGHLVEYYLTVLEYHNVVDRKYMKVQETLAKVFGMVKSCFIILLFINIFLSTHYFHMIFKDSFFLYFEKQRVLSASGRELSEKKSHIQLSPEKRLKPKEVETNERKQQAEKRMDEYNRLFTFINFVRFKFCFCRFKKNKNANKFVTMYEEFRKYLFIENISIFSKKKVSKENFIKHRTFIESLLKRTDRVMKNFDLLTSKQIFYINRNSTFQTKIGGIMSIIYIIIAILFFYLFGSDFWLRTNPDIQVYQANYNEFENSSDLWHGDFPIVVGYSKELRNNTRWLNYEPYINDFRLNYGVVPCNQTYYKLLNENTLNSTLAYDCLNLDVLGNRFNGGVTFGDFFLQGCSGSGDPNCEQDPDPNKKYYLEWAMNASYLNYSNYDNFIQADYIHRNVTNIFEFLDYGAFIFKRNVFIDDRGLLYNIDKPYSFTSIPWRYWDKSERGGLRMRFNLFPTTITTTTRRFLKFADMLAKVTAMLSIVSLVMGIAYSNISDYLFLRYFLKDFFSNIDVNAIESRINKNIVGNESNNVNTINPLDEKKFLTEDERKEKLKEYYELITFKNFVIYSNVSFIYKFKGFEVFKELMEEFKKFFSIEKLLITNNESISSEEISLSDVILDEDNVKGNEEINIVD
jgi:hypothetical protein